MNQPPKYAQKFLNWFLKEKLAEEVLGDLEEKFDKNLKYKSPFKAKVNYWYQTLNYLRPFAIKNNIITGLNPFFMWQHHLKITFRKFQRNKTAFGINLIGLSTGLACALLIFMWVQDELSVDKFNEKDSQLYEVAINAEMPRGIHTWGNSPGPLAAALEAELPEVKAAISTHNNFMQPKGILVDGDKKLEIKGMYARPNFFDIFTYPLLEGTKTTVLKDKYSIVITRATATKLFGSTTEAMNKMVTWKNEYFNEIFQVKGVCENPPTNATNQFDAVIQYQWLVDVDRYADDWSGGYANTYVVLKEGVNIPAFNEKMTKLYYANRGKDFNKPRELFLRKYSDLYLYGHYENGVQSGGRIAYVKLFTIIAFFILLIACINFMNLSTAQATQKMKEIGVKKTMGVRRKSLVSQFLGESVITTFIGLGLALILVHLLLPYFNNLTGKQLLLDFNPMLVAAILGFGLLTGLLAGSYPALYLSKFDPITVLKGKWNAQIGGDQWVRKGLVVFQFALSIIFIVGVLVVQQQMDYAQTKNLGYDRENVISFQRVSNNGDPQVFLTELSKIPGVINAANIANKITNRYDNQSGYNWRGEAADEKILFEAPRIGYNVIETLGMELAAGRSFSRELKDSMSKIVINESAAKMMGLENPVGTFVKKGSGAFEQQQEIIGVVKDFQYGSIHKKIEPLIFRFRARSRRIIARIQAGEEQTTIPKIEALYKKFHPEHAFTYSFLDSDYQRLYESESKVAILSKFFSGLAIIISCLGLFGLAMFTAERRRKEIGIRKVLGASVFGIVQMLTKDFTKTVLVAILVATPFSYWVAQNWLANFAYRIDLNTWHFIVPGLLVLLVAWSTVGLQTVQAARANPVKALKSE